MRRRQLLLGSATLAGAGLLTGADAFETTSVERAVTVAVVADDEAYLGLDEDGVEEDLLFGAGNREEPVEFEITNGLPTDVDVTVELDDGEFVFDGHDDDVSAELGPGTAESVNVELDGEPTAPKTDTLSFSVVDTDGDAIDVEVDRELTLEPDEINGSATLANGNSILTIEHPDQAEVDLSTVTAERDGVELETTIAGNGNSGNLKLDLPGGSGSGSGSESRAGANSSVPGCDSPDDTTEFTITGETKAGIPFSATVSDVNCAATGSGDGAGNSNDGTDDGDSETGDADNEGEGEGEDENKE